MLERLYPKLDPSNVVRCQGDEALRRFHAWRQARLDKAAAEHAIEAHENWFRAQGPDAGAFALDDGSRIEVRERSRKGYTAVVPATTYRAFTLKPATGDEPAAQEAA
jgi:hypothetical protein